MAMFSFDVIFVPVNKNTFTDGGIIVKTTFKDSFYKTVITILWSDYFCRRFEEFSSSLLIRQQGQVT